MLIYKILRPSEWAEFDSSGIFMGSPDDKRDGFVHFSSRAQVAATARRIFGEEPELVIVAMDTDTLGETVRWERSGSGTFPHVYGALSRDAVVAVHRVEGADRIEAAIPEQ
ncbi:MAG TPA: DUF952 domain-containing protein [Acidimicrobiales bacterium]|nr:DUF952 domain-containing protein [Acidimicrobiales bacterium]